MCYFPIYQEKCWILSFFSYFSEMAIFLDALDNSTFSVDFREKVLLTGRVVYCVSMPKIQKYDTVVI